MEVNRLYQVAIDTGFFLEVNYLTSSFPESRNLRLIQRMCRYSRQVMATATTKTTPTFITDSMIFPLCRCLHVSVAAVALADDIAMLFIQAFKRFSIVL